MFPEKQEPIYNMMIMLPTIIKAYLNNIVRSSMEMANFYVRIAFSFRLLLTSACAGILNILMMNEILCDGFSCACVQFSEKNMPMKEFIVLLHVAFLVKGHNGKEIGK